MQFSPDTRHFVFAAETGPGACATVIDGKLVDRVAGVVPDSLMITNDSGTLVFVALAEGKQQVIIDGRVHRTHGFVEPRSLTYPPAGDRLIYIAAEPDSRGEYFVVAGTKVSKGYPRVANVAVSGDGKKVAYAAYPRAATGPGAGSSGSSLGEPDIRIDDEVVCAGAFRVVFSPDSKRMACVRGVRDGRFPYGIGQQVVVDGVADAAVARVGSIVFSEDSRHYAYDVPGGVGLTSALVVDGESIVPPMAVAFRRLRFAESERIEATTISGGGERADVYRRIDFTIGR
jgi:hypothetical protein